MILLKLGGKIKGDSQVDGHKDWIEIQSAQFGVGRSIMSTTGGSDREVSTPSVSEVTLTKLADQASIDLFIEAATGKEPGDAEIEWVNVGDKVQTYMKAELKGALISGYSLSSGGDRPSESLSLNFTSIKLSYWKFDGKTVTPISPKGLDLEKLKKM